MTDLKLLAATCNFGMLHDSLIRIRIICGIRNSTLCEELLKVVDLDLDKCLHVCRVSELSKERNKVIEATESINAVQIRSMKVSQRKSARQKALIVEQNTKGENVWHMAKNAPSVTSSIMAPLFAKPNKRVQLRTLNMLMTMMKIFQTMMTF